MLHLHLHSRLHVVQSSHSIPMYVTLSVPIVPKLMHSRLMLHDVPSASQSRPPQGYPVAVSTAHLTYIVYYISSSIVLSTCSQLSARPHSLSSPSLRSCLSSFFRPIHPDAHDTPSRPRSFHWVRSRLSGGTDIELPERPSAEVAVPHCQTKRVCHFISLEYSIPPDIFSLSNSYLTSHREMLQEDMYGRQSPSQSVQTLLQMAHALPVPLSRRSPVARLKPNHLPNLMLPSLPRLPSSLTQLRALILMQP
jgi:hypothetical protein